MAIACHVPCDCSSPHISGNDALHHIPVKIGEPLSAACERVTGLGSIPEVIRYPGWTRVGGGVVQSRVTMGGICNIASFFKHRSGCFYNEHAQLSGSTCC